MMLLNGFFDVFGLSSSIMLTGQLTVFSIKVGGVVTMSIAEWFLMYFGLSPSIMLTGQLTVFSIKVGGVGTMLLNACCM